MKKSGRMSRALHPDTRVPFAEPRVLLHLPDPLPVSVVLCPLSGRSGGPGGGWDEPAHAPGRGSLPAFLSLREPC